MFKTKFWIAISAILIVFSVVQFSIAANQPLTVTRGGTGTDTVLPGQFMVGESIDRLVATSSIEMDMDTGAISIGDISVDAVSEGDMLVAGDLGVATTSPGSALDVFSTASTTVTIDSNHATRGGCLKIRDIDGGGFSYGTVLDGAVTWSGTSCE